MVMETGGIGSKSAKANVLERFLRWGTHFAIVSQGLSLLALRFYRQIRSVQFVASISGICKQTVSLYWETRRWGRKVMFPLWQTWKENQACWLSVFLWRFLWDISHEKVCLKDLFSQGGFSPTQDRAVFQFCLIPIVFLYLKWSQSIFVAVLPKIHFW